jgi:predicted neuraminidase
MLILFMLTLSVCSSAQTAGQAALTASMLVIPLQHEHVHASTIVMLPNGDYLAAWFQGSGETTADDARIMGARLVRGAPGWSAPFLMADTRGLPDCNPVLFMSPGGKLFLVWIAVEANRWEASLLRCRTTRDYRSPGAPRWTWQDDILLKPDSSFRDVVTAAFRELPDSAGWGAYAPPYGRLITEAAGDPVKRSTGWMTRQPPLVLPSGRILLPLYSDGFNFSIVAVSDDDGDSWRPSHPIVGKGDVQPALVMQKDGTVMALMRDNGDAPSRLQVSRSRDQGETWSVARKTAFPQTASVAAVALGDGRWAMVANGQSDGRHRLSLYLSSTEGSRWRRALVLEDAPGGRFSYPTMIRDNSGLLHITYSDNPVPGEEAIKYVVVDPRRLP